MSTWLWIFAVLAFFGGCYGVYYWEAAPPTDPFLRRLWEHISVEANTRVVPGYVTINTSLGGKLIIIVRQKYGGEICVDGVDVTDRFRYRDRASIDHVVTRRIRKQREVDAAEQRRKQKDVLEAILRRTNPTEE